MLLSELGLRVAAAPAASWWRPPTGLVAPHGTPKQAHPARTSPTHTAGVDKRSVDTWMYPTLFRMDVGTGEARARCAPRMRGRAVARSGGRAGRTRKQTGCAVLHGTLLQLHKRRSANRVSTAGAPPDYFDPNGQNWGFPTYNWEEMGKDGCRWWRRRLTHMAE